MFKKYVLFTVLIFLTFVVFGNDYHKKINNLSEKERIEFFDNYLKRNADQISDRFDDCEVQQTFLQGYDKNSDGYFWNVKCKRGEDLGLFVLPNNVIQILECSILAEAGLTCFVKF